MRGKATVAGHPIHPLMVTLPIGCFVAALIADIVSIWAGPAFFPAMATWLIAFGVISAIVAAFSGVIDYLTAPMSAEAKGLAAWHMTLNLAVIIIFGTAFALRYGHYDSVSGHVLTVLGVVVLLVSGWLGGEIAHRHLVGSSEADVDVPRKRADVSTAQAKEYVPSSRGRVG
jgi:uncharacterized membrane protein